MVLPHVLVMVILPRLRYWSAKFLLFVFHLWVLFKASRVYQIRWTVPRLLVLGFATFIVLQIYTQGKMERLRRSDGLNLMPPIEEAFKPHCGGHWTSERKLGLSELAEANVASNREVNTLVVYNYYESEGAVDNLRFFVRHGLHERPDVHFLFVLSSEPCVSIPLAPNVAIVHSNEGCYGFAAIRSSLTRLNMNTRYKKYILSGSWVKGPFMPTWSTDCWTDAFTRLLTDYHQLSGTTYSCLGPGARYGRIRPHLHPTAWAVTQNALPLVLGPYMCTDIEPLGSSLIQASNYKLMRQNGLGVTALVSSFELDPLESCPSNEWQYYEHPFETIFANPRNGRTLKRESYVDPSFSEQTRLYDYLAISEVAMRESSYDSRKYCTVKQS